MCMFIHIQKDLHILIIVRSVSERFSKNTLTINIKNTLKVSNKELYNRACMSPISEDVKMRQWR